MSEPVRIFDLDNELERLAAYDAAHGTWTEREAVFADVYGSTRAHNEAHAALRAAFLERFLGHPHVLVAQERWAMILEPRRDDPLLWPERLRDRGAAAERELSSRFGDAHVARLNAAAGVSIGSIEDPDWRPMFDEACDVARSLDQPWPWFAYEMVRDLSDKCAALGGQAGVGPLEPVTEVRPDDEFVPPHEPVAVHWEQQSSAARIEEVRRVRAELKRLEEAAEQAAAPLPAGRPSTWSDETIDRYAATTWDLAQPGATELGVAQGRAMEAYGDLAVDAVNAERDRVRQQRSGARALLVLGGSLG